MKYPLNTILKMKATINLLVFLACSLFFLGCDEKGKAKSDSGSIDDSLSIMQREANLLYDDAKAALEKARKSKEEADRARLKIGLALGGGGAKAAAEIGALKYLDEKKVHIDCIAGTSMGAVVGGLYAAGYSGQEIEDLWFNNGWLRLFVKDAIGSNHNGSYKSIERSIFGVIDGDEFENKLREALRAKGVTRFEDLKDTKFCCTATSIVDDYALDSVILAKGDMAKAIRASMSYPAPLVGFSPIRINGKMLVDGGLLNNLPVDVVKKKMKADKVIAIDLETKWRQPKNVGLLEDIGFLLVDKYLGAALHLTKTQWLERWLKKKPDIEMHNRNFRAADVKIQPNLIDYSILSFKTDDIRKMILIGRHAMRDQFYEVIDLLENRKSEKRTSEEQNKMIPQDASTSSNKENGHTYVDLGLSVKWARCNIGASTPEGYGDFFAWGETRIKSSYNVKNYIFRSSGSWAADIKLTKYNTNSEKGNVDGKKKLFLVDDAAYMNWGGGWRMPTIDEIRELVSRCKWTATTKNGVNGCLVTGPNGNSIFLPATGLMSDNESIGKGERVCLWSSSLLTEGVYPCSMAYCLIFYANDSFCMNKDFQNDMDRENGLKIRAVIQ